MLTILLLQNFARRDRLAIERKIAMDTFLSAVLAGFLKAVGAAAALVGLYFGAKWGWKLNEYFESRKGQKID